MRCMGRILLAAILVSGLVLPVVAAAADGEKPPSSRLKMPIRKVDKEKENKPRPGQPPARPSLNFSPAAGAALQAVKQRRKALDAMKAKAAEDNPEGQMAAKALALSAARADTVIEAVRQRLAGTGDPSDAVLALKRLARGQIPPPEGAPQPPKEEEKPKDAPPDPEAAAKAKAEELARPAIQARAMLLMGDLHMEGRAVKASHSQAYVWFVRAAKLGNAEAAYRIGILGERGIGIPKSGGRAVEWYEVASEGPSIPGLMRLAQAHEAGELDLRLDPRAALGWYRLAAKAGSEEARRKVQALEAERPASQGGIEAVADRVARAVGGSPTPETAVPLDLGSLGAQGGAAVGAALGQAMGEALGMMAEGMVKGMAEAMGGAGLRFGEPAEPDGVLGGLIDRYVAAVNARDPAALESLFQPDSKACLTEENRATYDGLLATKLERPLDAVHPAPRLYRLAAEGPLPFDDLMDYPRRPTHYMMAELATKDGGKVRFDSALVGEDGKWSFVFPCLKPDALAWARGAREARASAGKAPLKLEPPKEGGGDKDFPRGPEGPLPGGGQAFVEKFLAAVKARDTQALDNMMHPKARACITQKTAPFFAFLNESLTDIDFSRPTRVQTFPFLEGSEPGRMPGGSYRALASHELKITYNLAQSADGRMKSSQNVSIYLAQEDGTWSTVPPCPTDAELAMLPMLRTLFDGMKKAFKP